MLTQKRIERCLFAGAILFGAIALFLGVPLLRDYSCRMPVQERVNTRQDNAATDKHNNQTGGSVKTENQNSDNANRASDQINTDYSPKSLFCGETKGTDLALVFFTYCLVIVGWFTLRSNERNLEALERAYIFHGYDPLRYSKKAAAINVVMINVGRMPGAVTEVGYKFLTRPALPLTRQDIDWTWEIIPYDFIVKSGMKIPIRTLNSPKGDNILVSYIKYRDMLTKHMHTSWMGMHIYPSRPKGEREAQAGGKTWNDWD